MDEADLDHVAELHTLAGPYALGALSDAERAAFERHLAGCEACQAEVGGLVETVARLADPTAEDPPPSLRAAVLADVARTAQGGAVPLVERPAAARAVGRWRGWAIAASVAAVLGVGVTWAVQEQRLDDARQAVQALRSDQARIAQVLAAGDVVSQSVPATGGGRVTVVTSRSLGTGVVLIDDMPSPGRENYQLWTVTGDQQVSAAVLPVGARSGTEFLDQIGDADTVGVTLEPAGGSEAPTGGMLAAVPLRA
ncbi:anti-sigma factor [Xylanimonas sp. McL0601]|uniref:anti-sigma factor n=1 Tax=Xylanimonas sp. McL0601 TaxID=3414739 RepID=UPI003CF1C2F3